jgi:predicted RNase H-like HicB family nuclease
VKPAEYGRVVVPESDGTFRAEIIEFPGCIAVGDTAGEALGSGALLSQHLGRQRPR